MSDSEGSDFNMVSDGESDGYVEAPTPKKAPAKKAAAAPKAKVSHLTPPYTDISGCPQEGGCHQEDSSCYQEEPSERLAFRGR